MAQSKNKILEIDDHIHTRFDMQRRLGKGAYGIVWRAVDRRTKDVIAVKKIFDAFRNQTDAQRTFREVMFLRSFKDHPNIIRLHSIHRAANNRDIYLGFEFMETDLHNVIKQNNLLKDVHKRYIMHQLFKAMKYIHSGNVIHRDLKPSNVLLDSLCRCKIADFGLARSLAQQLLGNSPNDTDPTLTDYVATRWYRAPEILISNRKYTKGIDMWSLGCILAEMLLGKPAFPGTSTVNQVEKIMETIPTPTIEDINIICGSSGVGASMIKNASATAKKLPLKTLLGPSVPRDALDLVSELIIFNPHERLTAENALKHHYVSRFRSSADEIEMNVNVIPPFSDDVRLSVDEYRNKLYEIMGAKNQLPIQKRVSKEKCHPRTSQSEEKLDSKPKPHSIKAFSDSKLSKRHELAKLPKSRIGAKSYVPQFDSRSRSRGIITQSALVELRAAGMR